MARQVLTIRADEDLIRLLQAIADRTGETRSVVAERCLRAGLEESAEAIEFIGRPMVRETLGRLLASPKFLSLVAGLAGAGEDDASIKARADQVGRIVKASRRGGKAGAKS